MHVVMATMPVSDEHALRTAVAAIIAAVAAVAAEAEVNADTCIGVGGADDGGANCDGKRGSGSQKDFLKHE